MILAIDELGQEQAQSLKIQLERALLPALMLGAVIRQNPDAGGFELLAADLWRCGSCVQALELAPAGVVSQIYPRDGNEAAFGLDLIKDPRRRAHAQATLDARQMSVVGPFELVQGGVGVLGMLPIFVPQAEGEARFWGFVLSVVSLTRLLQESKIEHLEERGCNYELSCIEPSGRHVFAHSQAAAPQDPLTIEIEVPNGQWVLSLAPRQGWRESTLQTSRLLQLLTDSLGSNVGSNGSQFMQDVDTPLQAQMPAQPSAPSPAPDKASEASSQESESKVEALTNREREIAALIGLGLRNKQIAAHLFLSERTVHNHMASIFRKLDISNRLELSLWAQRHGLNASPLPNGPLPVLPPEPSLKATLPTTQHAVLPAHVLS